MIIQKDKTEDILNIISLEDNRIKIINHSINKGVYYSRIEAILNSNGKYILLMDPDDMLLNEDLFLELYNYNWNNNLDIIEFTIYHQIDGRRNIIYPNKQFKTHYHNYSKNIIYQPELSRLLFKDPDKNVYSSSFCRSIWNKMIRKNIFLDVHEFIGIDYLNQYAIIGDDMLINAICYHFANNYSNIDLPGYMYNLRDISMSHDNGGIELQIIRSINYFFYFKILYKYIKLFKINIKSLYYEMKIKRYFIYFFKDCNVSLYKKDLKDFINEIISDENASLRFKIFLSDTLLYMDEENNNNMLDINIKIN